MPVKKNNQKSNGESSSKSTSADQPRDRKRPESVHSAIVVQVDENDTAADQDEHRPLVPPNLPLRIFGERGGPRPRLEDAVIHAFLAILARTSDDFIAVDNLTIGKERVEVIHKAAIAGNDLQILIPVGVPEENGVLDRKVLVWLSFEDPEGKNYVDVEIMDSTTLSKAKKDERERRVRDTISEWANLLFPHRKAPVFTVKSFAQQNKDVDSGVIVLVNALHVVTESNPPPYQDTALYWRHIIGVALSPLDMHHNGDTLKFLKSESWEKRASLTLLECITGVHLAPIAGLVPPSVPQATPAATLMDQLDSLHRTREAYNKWADGIRNTMIKYLPLKGQLNHATTTLDQLFSIIKSVVQRLNYICQTSKSKVVDKQTELSSQVRLNNVLERADKSAGAYDDGIKKMELLEQDLIRLRQSFWRDLEAQARMMRLSRVIVEAKTMATAYEGCKVPPGSQAG